MLRKGWLVYNLLVVRAVGSQSYESGSLLTRSEMFSLVSVTFSKFLRVCYLYTCLVTFVLHINTLFIDPLWYTLQSVLPCFLFSHLVGALLVWVCLADLLYFQYSVWVSLCCLEWSLWMILKLYILSDFFYLILWNFKIVW